MPRWYARPKTVIRAVLTAGSVWSNFVHATNDAILQLPLRPSHQVPLATWALTTSVDGDDGTWKTLLPRHWRLSDVVVVVVVGRCVVRRRGGGRLVVVADDAEVIGGAARRRRPVERADAGGQPVCQWHPLTHCPVLDHVVVGRTTAGHRRRHRPRDVQAVTQRTYRHVERRRRSISLGYRVYTNHRLTEVSA